MAIDKQIVFNNEIQINEHHTNKYLFVLDRIPTSFLLSKFTDVTLNQIINGSSNAPDEIRKLLTEVFKERNQDLKNYLLYLQNVNLPGMSVEYATIGTQFASIKHVNGKISFDELQMNILLDENYLNYRMMFYWLMAAFNPEERMKYTEYDYYKNFYVNGHLIMLNNHHEKIMEFEFTDLHPVSLGQIELTEKTADKSILPVTWIYTTMVESDRYVIKHV